MFHGFSLFPKYICHNYEGVLIKLYLMFLKKKTFDMLFVFLFNKVFDNYLDCLLYLLKLSTLSQNLRHQPFYSQKRITCFTNNLVVLIK